MVRFSVSALEKAPVLKQGELPAEFLDLAQEDLFQAVAPVEYSLAAKTVSGGVLVSGSCSCRMRSCCGRCLQDFEFTLQAENIQMFYELEEAQEELDVTDDLRAELLLELPMNPLCRRDCRGLCPECGCDLNHSDCSCQSSTGSNAVSPWSALDGLKLDQ